MRGILIIVFKPARKLRHHRFGGWPIIAEDVIPFECFNDSLSHAVALGAASRSKLADDSQRGGKSYCFSCRVAGSVVREPFNRPQCFDISKPFFNACQHDALRHVGAVPTSGGGKGHHFQVTSIQRKNNAHLLAVVAGNLKSIRTPTLIRSQSGNFARVSFAGLLAGKPRQQKIVLPHYPVYALVIDRRAAAGKQLTIKQPLNTPIAIGLASSQDFDD